MACIRQTRMSLRANCRGFTIVEVLIVIAVIAILLALLVPSVGRARAKAYEIRCASNQRNLIQAFFAFAADNKGRLPGNWFDGSIPDPRHRSWLRNNNEGFATAPEAGTLWKYKYIQNREVYLCPTLESIAVNGGVGSNGRFDYAAFAVLSGARISDLQKSETTFTHADGRVERGMMVPLICEEEPVGGINGGNMEGGHCNTDRMTHIHRGGTYIAYIDGSVGWFLEPTNCNCWNWRVKAPSGAMIQLGNSGTWASWDAR